jgi:hypothetical protein
MNEAEQIMRRCQAGTRNYEEANNLHAACYGIIGKLLAQRTEQDWDALAEKQLASIKRDTKATTEDATVRAVRVVFPTMLRKMWSGGEVQQWLDENVNKENT